MANILSSTDTITHLRGHNGLTLCGIARAGQEATPGELTCPDCAHIVLRAVEGSTKKERRSWRELNV
jgi:hypothetical protein